MNEHDPQKSTPLTFQISIFADCQGFNERRAIKRKADSGSKISFLMKSFQPVGKHVPRRLFAAWRELGH